MRFFRILALLIGVAFLLLLVVGFDNVLAAFRSRVTLALVLGPLILLFLWCVYKAFQPPRLTNNPPPRERKS
jgi:apolipoprotein N-acyltransferase